MKNFTTAIIEEKLTQGWTTKQFATYYEMTEKEFLSSLDKISTVKNYIDGIKRRLSKNDKKSHLTSTIKTQTLENIEVEVLKSIEPENTSFTETDSIDELLKRMENLKDSIRKSEYFIGNTPSYISHIEEQIARENARHESYIAGYQEKIDKAIARKNAILQDIQKNSEELEIILQKIESLSNINVRVTKDGDIIIENNTISIPKKWQDACFDIMRDNNFKDLEIKDMKILAKLWSLLDSEDNLSKKIKISFESSYLEEYFKLLKEHKKN